MGVSWWCICCDLERCIVPTRTLSDVEADEFAGSQGTNHSAGEAIRGTAWGEEGENQNNDSTCHVTTVPHSRTACPCTLLFPMSYGGTNGGPSTLSKRPPQASYANAVRKTTPVFRDQPHLNKKCEISFRHESIPLGMNLHVRSDSNQHLIIHLPAKTSTPMKFYTDSSTTDSSTTLVLSRPWSEQGPPLLGFDASPFKFMLANRLVRRITIQADVGQINSFSNTCPSLLPLRLSEPISLPGNNISISDL
jgi:hypothetical protein